MAGGLNKRRMIQSAVFKELVKVGQPLQWKQCIPFNTPTMYSHNLPMYFVICHKC